MPLKLYSLVLILVLGWSACQSKKTDNESPDVITAAYETPSFLEFYDRFGKDSVFQMNHITFPLEGMKSVKNEETIIDPDFRWSQDEWILHKSFDDMDGTFIKEFYDINGIVIEIISDPSGKFSMERRFGKLSQGWHLIYYREMGIYE
jgi:hypothetical protein